MGQKANPIGNRLGIIKGWDSNWYGGKHYADKLVEDEKIRNYLRARLGKASISKIVIERTMKLVTVTIHTARPGIIIGKGGKEVDKLKEEMRQYRTPAGRPYFFPPRDQDGDCINHENGC
jgi:small subunit ribosomal protein S3